MNKTGNIEYINKIRTGKYSIIAVKNEAVIFSQNERSITPVISLYESGLMNGADVYDKIIGEAAAHVLILGGAAFVYAGVLSKGAAKLLKNADVTVQYKVLTDCIINRQGTGLCPMECAVKQCKSHYDAYLSIKEKIKSIK